MTKARQAIYDAYNVPTNDRARLDKQLRTDLPKLAKLYKVKNQGPPDAVGNKILKLALDSNKEWEARIIKRIEARQRYTDTFFATFQKPLRDFWNPITGLNVVKLDELVQPKPNQSLSAAIEERYGKIAATMIRELL